MTIIIADKKGIAADRRITCVNYKYTGTKLQHFVDEHTGLQCVLGTCGNSQKASEFAAWFENNWIYDVVNRDYEEAPVDSGKDDMGMAFTAIVLYNDGRIGEFFNAYFELPVEMDFHAHGSGRDFALGSYHQNQDLVKAVETANALHNECGGGWDAYFLEDTEKRAGFRYVFEHRS